MAVVKVTYIQGVVLCSLLTQCMLGLRPTCFANQISELGVTSRLNDQQFHLYTSQETDVDAAFRTTSGKLCLFLWPTKG